MYLEYAVRRPESEGLSAIFVFPTRPPVVSASRSNYVLRFQQKLFGVPPVLGTAITMPTPSLFVS